MIHFSHTDFGAGEDDAQAPDPSLNTMRDTPWTASRLPAHGPRAVCLTCGRAARSERRALVESWLSDGCDPVHR